jgi:hypothetical protein
MFTVTIGTDPSGSDDHIELQGDLSPFAGLPGNLTIAVGRPGGLKDSSLPPFTIPFGRLGASGGDYRRVKLQVNQDATLRIEDAPAASGAPGYFTNGTVEVSTGGALWGGGSLGLPLGDGLIIRNNIGSSRAFDAAGAQVFIGTGAAGAPGPIQWDGGDQVGHTIETRAPKNLAISAGVTITRTLTLDYNIWIFNTATVTIDAQSGPASPDGLRGLFSTATNPPNRMYGTKTVTGGQNIAYPAAEIILKPGSSINAAFFFTTPASTYITAANAKITIANQGAAGSPVYYDNGTSMGAYFNWE